MFVILSAIPAVQSCLVSGLAMFSHAILFSLLPRYLCVLPSISVVALGATWNLCVLPSIVALGATWRHQLSGLGFAARMSIWSIVLTSALGCFRLGFFLPHCFSLLSRFFWVCGGFFP